MNALMAAPTSTPGLGEVYRAQVVDSLQEFAQIRSHWDHLIQNSGLDTINLDYLWLSTWMESFPNQSLFLILIYNDQDELIAGAPLKISQSPSGLMCRLLRHLQFIGTDPCVYDWMVFPMVHSANEAQVIETLANCLFEHRTRWDLMDFRYLQSETQLAHLNRILSSWGRRTTHHASMVIPTRDLPETVEEYEASVKHRGYKRNLKRILNQIRREFNGEPVVVDVLENSPETMEQIALFFDHHRTYWASKGIKCDLERYPNLVTFYHRIYQGFAKDLSNPNKVLFTVLKIGSRIISYNFDFLSGKSIWGHLSGYDPAYRKYRPGVLHIELLLHFSIQNGMSRFEFGRGDQSYKDQWANHHIQLWNLMLWNTPWAFLFWKTDQVLKKLVRKPLFSSQ